MSGVLTPRQLAALDVCSGPATHVALRGGSRSGKTVLHVRNIVARALKSPGSRHAIFRFRFNHVKQSVGLETMPMVLATFFPALRGLEPDKSDWYWKLPNAAEVWLGGLDDKERTEKILGKEYVTLFPNECSQIPWPSIGMLKTRLAQKVEQIVPGQPVRLLKPRMFYDYNPPPKSHWTYKVFERKVDPDTGTVLPDGENYAVFKLNPEDNVTNLAEGYLDTLRNAGPRLRLRFLEGEYAEANPYALFNDIAIETWRVRDGDVPDMVRIVVAVDPSGASDTSLEGEADPIGIVVVGLGTDGNAYVLEDATILAGPETWGHVATTCFERHGADVVVGEKNFGGDMVRLTIQVARRETPYKHVSASRGKVVRAEPFAALYEQGRIRHVGRFAELEDELLSFSTVGYLGTRSPNRADALVWALAELFPAIVRGQPKAAPPQVMSVGAGRGFWNRRR